MLCWRQKQDQVVFALVLPAGLPRFDLLAQIEQTELVNRST
jgi:hypothetical protein